jgi:Spx/MgsR family transcriptional regulator
VKAVLWMKSSCTTCRDAKAKLVALGIEVEVRDYSKKPLELAELEALLPTDPGPMLGTKSPKYKELRLRDRRLTKAEGIALILQDNNLLKRPILMHSKAVIIGFDPEAYGTLVT